MKTSTSASLRSGVLAAAFGLLVACGGSSSTPTAATTSTPDRATAAYVALVKGFWSDYRAAEINGPEADAASACLNRPNLPVCLSRMKAMMPPLQTFLASIAGGTAPPRFAADDAIFRTQLPIAIGDLKGAIQALAANQKTKFEDKVNAYVDDMVPKVTGALDDVDPNVVHN